MTSTSLPNARPRGYQPPTPQQVVAARDLVSRFETQWQRGDAEGLRDLMHEDTRNLIPPMTQPADREGVVAHFAQVLARLPDLRLAVLRWGLTGDTVMIEWRATATVAGAPLSWEGMDVMRLRDNRMYEAQVYWNTRLLENQVASRIAAATAKAKAQVQHAQ
ncbi:MAG: nuclear transport factor 2 family protein [Polaromonas sp.]|uniref:nuclear transport factor 2 family protein n=1 Tax=Polaromonas sp. TaxID=1869339 RepID=UPI001801BE25|nr:nuclear transport factor 2 family protein [Polaromonas sp.]MBA3592944.1 nuclear transport factor 2 family protein [Polaromonas sp.]